MSSEQVFKVNKTPTKEDIIEGSKYVLVTKIGQIITDNKAIQNYLFKDNVDQKNKMFDVYLYKFPINKEINEEVILQHYNENMDKNKLYEQEKEKEQKEVEKEEGEKAQMYEEDQNRKEKEEKEEEEKKVHDINVNSEKFIIKKISKYLTKNKNIDEGFVVGGYLRLSIKNIDLPEDEIEMEKNTLEELKMRSGVYFKRMGNNKVYINLKLSDNGNDDDDGIPNSYFLENQELFSIRPIIEGKILPVSKGNMMKNFFSNLPFLKKKAV